MARNAFDGLVNTVPNFVNVSSGEFRPFGAGIIDGCQKRQGCTCIE